ncbi:hypothetical protein DFJ66_8090 [Saccharothrix variisporea]|uniref:Uncharacterized protein n=1 Tax=Saccharothrix variisporea TaxID=543527 RepID=A0A495XLG5_9PSEU|nr:hypothetical protein DFJ66_8090 [Saccharothrix variisporea]
MNSRRADLPCSRDVLTLHDGRARSRPPATTTSEVVADVYVLDTRPRDDKARLPARQDAVQLTIGVDGCGLPDTVKPMVAVSCGASTPFQSALRTFAVRPRS